MISHDSRWVNGKKKKEEKKKHRDKYRTFSGGVRRENVQEQRVERVNESIHLIDI